MVGDALRHDRASSYNNVLASSEGDVVNVEGSATAAELTEPEGGGLVHTNHYVCDSMLSYEGDPGYAESSAIRYRRAEQLLSDAQPTTVDEDMLRRWLSDHDGAPNSICKHDHPDVGSVTCFWCIADVTNGQVTYGRGNPCDSMAQRYLFDGYAAV